MKHYARPPPRIAAVTDHDAPTSPEAPAPTQRSATTFALKSPVAWLIFLAVLVVGLGADLWTKKATWDHFVHDTAFVNGRYQPILNGKDDITVVPNLLELTAVANHGAAMGLGQGRRTIFIGVSVVAVGILMFFFAGSGDKRSHQALLGMLLAGVLGNFYDRLFFGYVRDMIHIFPGVKYGDVLGFLPDVPVFPWVFNLADVYLCVGVAIVMVWSVFFADRDEATDSAKASAAEAT